MLSVEREPVVAGTFYNADAKALKKQLEELFQHFNSKKIIDNIAALIVPHAGYVYSGEVAASAYALLSPEANYDNVFIIGSSHHVAFQGASVYNKGHYKTPLGVVPVNLEIANTLINQNDHFSYKEDAHAEEHTIEVQLPFLQHRLHHLKNIVPIVLGVKEYDLCERIASALQPYFNNNNLFVISTDLSHYPTDEMARFIDEHTVDAICSNKASKLISALEYNRKQHIPNLYTGLCGWSSVLTLLYLSQGYDKMVFQKVKYMTSGEMAFHDKNRVVGYQSIVLKRDVGAENLLSEEEKNVLLESARKVIYSHLGNDYSGKSKNRDYAFDQSDSAFVSVYVGKELRGCIGQFSSHLKLDSLVKELAISAAFEDSRFTEIELEELDDLKIEISVLTPMRKIHDIEDIELGKHGVYITKEGRKGTFLPQVALKTGWTLEEFLGHLSRDKAHIGWDGWRDADIYVFEAIIFSD